MPERALYTARKEDLVVQELGDELLIYDRTWDVAHCLTQTAARVWQACEGGATLDDIADALVAEGDGKTSTREEAAAMAERALTELEEKGLLEDASGAVSRRHALRKIAGIGAGALAAPLVVSAAVPRSAEAYASPAICINVGGTCTTGGTFGGTAGNNCCGPGVKSCTGSTGCYCGTGKVCANCTATGTVPPTAAAGCPDSPCTQNGTNRCCCSGICGTTGATKKQCG